MGVNKDYLIYLLLVVLNIVKIYWKFKELLVEGGSYSIFVIGFKSRIEK